jgi:superoxide dismutase, Fe-Mn family
MPPELEARIADDFGSVEVLKNEMLAMAYSMFGPGFVWLVRTDLVGSTQSRFQKRSFRLLSTYMGGSPLAGAHNRQQPVDMNTQNVAAAQAAGGLRGLSEQEQRRQMEVQNRVGSMGRHAQRAPPASFGGVHVIPCLVVNTWQHAWLPDHGVNGKMAFLQKWWDLINWDQVVSLSGVLPSREAQANQDATLQGFDHPSTSFIKS